MASLDRTVVFPPRRARSTPSSRLRCRRSAGNAAPPGTALAGMEHARLADAARAPSTNCPRPTRTTQPPPTIAARPRWLGENGPALEMLDRYVTLETDEEKAGDAWAAGRGAALCLRHGRAVRLPRVFGHVPTPRCAPHPGRVADWDRGRRLIPLNTGEQEGVFSALILEPAPTFTATPGATRGWTAGGLPSHRAGRYPPVGAGARTTGAGADRVRAEGPRRLGGWAGAASAVPPSATW